MQSQSISEMYAEGQRYFMGEGRLNNALVRLVGDLKEHDIDYVVIGAIALLAYGYPRFTEDIDLILTHESLERCGARDVPENAGFVPRQSALGRDLRNSGAVPGCRGGVPQSHPE